MERQSPDNYTRYLGGRAGRFVMLDWQTEAHETVKEALKRYPRYRSSRSSAIHCSARRSIDASRAVVAQRR
jgi:hypothetical protein